MSSALLEDTLAPLRASPATTAVLLDVDGTLAPIVEYAAEASVPEQTRRLLSAIARRYRTVACISGRRAAEARAMVAVGTISYVGSHGGELLFAGRTHAELDPRLAEWADAVAAFRRSADTRSLRGVRVRIEDKGPIVAFHWRGAPDEQAAIEAVSALAERAEADGLLVHRGRKVLEVRPPVRFDKADGVAAMVAQAPVTGALYAGDDVTDLDAFRALRSMVARGELARAVLIGVRSPEGPPEIEAEADLVVDGTDGFAEVLSALAAG